MGGAGARDNGTRKRTVVGAHARRRDLVGGADVADIVAHFMPDRRVASYQQSAVQRASDCYGRRVDTRVTCRRENGVREPDDDDLLLTVTGSRRIRQRPRSRHDAGRGEVENRLRGRPGVRRPTGRRHVRAETLQSSVPQAARSKCRPFCFFVRSGRA